MTIIRKLEAELQALSWMLSGRGLKVNEIPGSGESLPPQLWVSASEHDGVIFKVQQGKRNRFEILIEVANHGELGDLTLDDTRDAIPTATILHDCCLTIFNIREKDFGWDTLFLGGAERGSTEIATHLKEVLMEYGFGEPEPRI